MLRSKLSFAVVSLFAVGVLACDDPKPTTTAPSGSAPATTAPAKTASAPTAKPTASAGSAKAGNMSHCPNAVEGATTEIADTKDGVDITVKGKDEAATKEIRSRAAHLVEASKKDSGATKHTGAGEGGGQFGRCPVVMKDTIVEAKDVDGGSVISVKAKSAAEVDFLRREAKERQAEMGEPGAKDAGQRKMANCPSAVEGATTTIKEGKDAIEVTVTAKSESATKDIRDRGKKVVEAAKVDSTDVKHTGDGKGGGGLGRCPVVLKDTTVEAKDVDGGAVFTVKPKKAADLAALVKETKERTDLFSKGGAPAGSGAPAASAAPSAKP